MIWHASVLEVVYENGTFSHPDPRGLHEQRIAHSQDKRKCVRREYSICWRFDVDDLES